jgi:SAM-dependent methyltransferase
VTPTAGTLAQLRREARRRLFLHQDGLALGISLALLQHSGVLQELRDDRTIDLDAMLQERSQGRGTLIVCLRACESAGWVRVVDGHNGARAVLTKAGACSAPLQAELVTLTQLVAESRTTLVDSTLDSGRSTIGGALVDAIRRASHAATTPDELVHRYLEGVVMTSMLPMTWIRTLDGSTNPDDLDAAVARFLPDCDPALVGALGTYVPMYGLLGSYADALLGAVRTGRPIRPADVRRLTDRHMNVRASGAAHRGYFEGTFELIEHAVGAAGPRVGIVDVGCGDGTWLATIFDSLQHSELSGRDIVLVGVDNDPRALDSARTQLGDRPAVLLEGDVGAPVEIARRVEEATGLSRDNVLHIRSFVDHNRVLDDSAAETMSRASQPVAVGGRGELIGGQDLLADWARHLRAWGAVLGRPGLVVVEAHTLPAAHVAASCGSVHLLAFELYHSLSGQSPIEKQCFDEALARAGLEWSSTTTPSWSPLISMSHVRRRAS